MTSASSPATAADFKPEEKRVIFASSLGTVFEWYDFYLYATLAPFFAALFFPKGNDTAALLSAFATYAAGFLVRPFGALVFGRVGDIVGRTIDREEDPEVQAGMLGVLGRVATADAVAKAIGR